jgi:hypothetical protein
MDRYYPVDVTPPLGFNQFNPIEVDVVTENAFLVDVEILIPRGHKGLTGIRIMQSGQQIIPWSNLYWLEADGYNRVFEVNSEIGANSLSIRAYNMDVFDHTFQVRFHIRDLFTGTGAEESALSSAASTIIGLTS